MSIGIALGTYLGVRGYAPEDSPSYWIDSAYDRRIAVTATNAQSIPLYDHVFDITVPESANINAASLRAVELTSIGTIDRAYDWRYALGSASPNKLPYLPVSISGTTVTVKLLGKWAASEARYIGLYWDSTAAVAAIDYTHMGGIAQTWSYVVGGTLTVGDVYKLIVGPAASPTTYTYTAIGGDTTTTIAQALRTLLNAGAVASATGGGATLTVTQASPDDVTFAVTSTGSTLATGTITITKPLYVGMGRTGPDTDLITTSSIYQTGAPLSTSGSMTKPGWGRVANEGLRVMTYTVNGVGTKNFDGATVTSIVDNGHSLTITGTLTDSFGKWSGAYTATLYHKIVAGRKSDVYPDDGAITLNKAVNVWHITLTYTCLVAYANTAITGAATGNTNSDLITLVNSDNVFTSNVTENGAGAPQTTGTLSQNAVANFYSDLATGVITAFTTTGANTALAALTVNGSIFGSHGNIVGTGLLINSAALAGFTGQSPTLFWQADSGSFPRLQIRTIAASPSVPINATATLDFWYLVGATGSATTVGDNLLPDEVVKILRGVAGTAPTVSVGSVERYGASGLTATMATAGTNNVEAIDWFQTNAVAKTTIARNGGYDWNVQTSVVSMTDDEDSNYGEAYKLAGLCLRYLRTRDATLITKIETQVQYHIDIEAAAVAAYGSFWSGSTPYFYWPSATPSSGYTAEGGVVGSTGTDYDPLSGFGSAFGTINYTQGQVRRKTSIDQMHMVTLGLYHYLYLLRNESAITANTTLRTNATSLLSRMVTFEAAHWTSATSRLVANLYRIVQSLTPNNNVGLTDSNVSTPYNGAQFGGWQVSDTDGTTIDPSSNQSIDNFINAVCAPDTVLSSTKRYMQGRTKDMLASDFGRHDITAGTANWNNSETIFTYPAGWLPRAAGGSTYKFTGGRSGDDHFILVSSGYRDSLNGRAPQRMAVIALTALLDPTYLVPIELTGGSTIVREVNIVTALDAMALTLATYLPEPTTKAIRYAVVGKMGETTSFDPQRIDSAYTGYWMYALELWYLVKAGAAYASYYPIGGPW